MGKDVSGVSDVAATKRNAEYSQCMRPMVADQRSSKGRRGSETEKRVTKRR